MKPTRGSVEVHGNIVPMLELGSGFDFELSGRENIYLNGAIMGYSRQFLDSKYRDIVDFSELGGFIEAPLRTYSSGMLARLAFSIACLVEPEILIVDEILSVGDADFQEKSRARMMELMTGGRRCFLCRTAWTRSGRCATRFCGLSGVLCRSSEQPKLSVITTRVKKMQGQIDLYTLSKEKVAPVLYGYVCWVIREAQKRKIRTLYFLARDGYVLREIAELICEKQNIQIECRYLYCSRASLRMPTYHLIGEEAYDLLFAGGYHVTLKSLLERTQIPEKLWHVIFAEAGIDKHVSLEENLCNKKIDWYKKRLIKSPLYTKLLNAAGWKGSIVGFYFGMFVNPLEAADGTYLTWYFSGMSGKKNKILFCNNLFECFLSAPHGMTIDYQENKKKMSPILKENLMNNRKPLIEQQYAGIISGAKKLAEDGEYISKKTARKYFIS